LWDDAGACRHLLRRRCFASLWIRRVGTSAASSATVVSSCTTCTLRGPINAA
jgi:hypothetical protein